MTTSMAERSVLSGRPSLGPSRRPPAGVRAIVGILAVGAAAFNVALMLSDRAPGITERIFGDFAVRLSDRLNRSERIAALAEGRNHGSDDIVHIGVWAVAMTLVGLAIWRWGPLILAAVALFLVSVVVELAQGRYSTTRAVERSDVLANGAGIAVGIAACAVCYLAWSGLAAIARRRPSD